MEKIKIIETDLFIGIPLEWAVYDEEGQLLLDKGYMLNSEKQKQILLTQGIFRLDFTAQTIEKPRPPTDGKFFKGTTHDTLKLLGKTLRVLFDKIHENTPDDYSNHFLDLAAVIQRLCRTQCDAVLGTILLDQSFNYSHIHPLLSAVLTELLGKRKQLNEDNRRIFIAAALTQNIGMLELQKKLANQASPLSDQQRDIIKAHPELGRALLQKAGINNAEWLNAVHNHHERIDGNGYPDGLSGDAIPVAARILSLTDIYSAMILPRAYRDGFYVKKALRDIFLQRGSAVDESLAHLLIKEIGIYPPGTFVLLANGETGVVLKRAPVDTESIHVLSLLNPQGKPFANPKQRVSDETVAFKIIKATQRLKNVAIQPDRFWPLSH
ncbi:MAG: HD domain-containing phosphohydrolase [Methylicorpusculum sp.]|uniref:HD-GYP domain-containing protein n=1 Tax=Methylicorpusculum sp. TaxID=2713644 RepID=UPI002725100E|nr:HD domain-containing phosphohydrolase [Methylicorpusculum sp.]MDO8843760.1 HD domain-containing phosphohydrolase [Methylicorpusculum sp.]MDO8939612.1 HD domain-containing phosphohydrolase [Methylicorpusculum sp.]MDP2180633.1 HD domain-containing phosphohydrolase [Methylicorpusculum sp.]MDP2203674.1 HD domain-containing phosphohydrolase [Methylicorpusculum sp.]MDP3530448.1 HD domain-containing phosphohydrolase [Methylicorpusculum sp.]